LLHQRRGRVHGGPAALPGAVAKVEILYVGGGVRLIRASQRTQLGGVVERAAAAAVEHPGPVLTQERLVAVDGKIFGRVLRHYRLAGLLPPHAFGEANLGGGAKQVRDRIERAHQRGEEARFEQHVVI
jgi:hypothetical protein